MPGLFSCPHCRRSLQDNGALAGQAVLCPHCNGQFVVANGSQFTPRHSDELSNKIPAFTPALSMPNDNARLASRFGRDKRKSWRPVATIITLLILMVPAVAFLVLINQFKSDWFEQSRTESSANPASSTNVDDSELAQNAPQENRRKIKLGNIEINVAGKGALENKPIEGSKIDRTNLEAWKLTILKHLDSTENRYRIKKWYEPVTLSRAEWLWETEYRIKKAIDSQGVAVRVDYLTDEGFDQWSRHDEIFCITEENKLIDFAQQGRNGVSFKKSLSPSDFFVGKPQR